MTQYVITGLTIDALALTWADLISDGHPEQTPIGPFDSREAAWEYASEMQARYGNGGGSVDVAVLYAPHALDEEADQ